MKVLGVKIKPLVASVLLGATSLLVYPAMAQPEQPAASQEASTPTVSHSSTLWKKDYRDTAGSWRIEDRGDIGRVLVIDRDFVTKNGDSLVILLSPFNQDRITKKNVLDRSIRLGRLKSPTGGQEYALPASFDTAQHKTIAIYGEKKKRVWATSAIAEGEVVYSATEWDKKTKKTSGGYEIVRRESGMFIRFSPDFKTAKPPEPLRILLSPLSAADAKNDNAERGAMLIAELRHVKGGQEYRVDDSVDFSRYNSVLLNCMKYTKLWSAAELTEQPG